MFLNLQEKVSALAKTSSLFTVLGNSPVILLNKIGPIGNWNYQLESKTHFVKLHPKAKHVFRFEGNLTCLFSLVEQSSDATFLGYPYGLVLVDKMARISNSEKKFVELILLERFDNVIEWYKIICKQSS